MLIGLLTIVLCLPALFGGLAMDDHVLARAVEEGQPAWDLFRFVDPTTRGPRTAEGMFGWWAAPDLEIEFWRPLSSVWHWVDVRVWGRAWPMYLESVLLYAALVMLVGVVYRRWLGSGAAVGWATVVFAVDDTHAQTIGWIANRNLVLATSLGFAALLAHDRWRRDGWRPGAVLGPMLLVAALASAEAGLAVCGYLFAHALCLDDARWRRRLLALSPYVAVAIVWRLVYVGLGYGVVASGMYRDPGLDPLGVLVDAFQRIGVMAFGQLTLPISSPLHAMPRGWWWALAGLTLLGWWLWPLLKRDRVARFFAVGMLMTAAPFATTVPSGRVLLPLGLGAAGLVAQVVTAAATADERDPWRPRWLARGALLLHVWISLLLFVPSLLMVRLIDGDTRALSAAVVGTATEAPVAVVVNVPLDVLLLHPSSIAKRAGEPWPSRVVPLYAGRGTVSLERVDDHSVQLRATAGWMASPINRFARAADRPMAVGERVVSPEVVVHVQKVNGAGRPTQILATFARRLDEVAWVAWVDGTPVAWPVPAVHSRYTLATEFSFMPSW
ncbi:MAG: hypothetical protein K0V04_07325 [Deltaproteobacteria bacterium]|nr:hypothetical protein [Deltaproteobacteria bacterium]